MGKYYITRRAIICYRYCEFREVHGVARDVEIAKWLINGRVQSKDKISTGPLSKIYPRIVESTSLLQVHEILQNEPFVVVIDSEKCKGKRTCFCMKKIF